jgi:acetyl-CoA synthetase
MYPVSASQLQKFLEPATDAKWISLINGWAGELPPEECWRNISKQLLAPEHPFELHHFLFNTVYAGWDNKQGPPPAWLPEPSEIPATNIGLLQKELGLNTYKELHLWSVTHRSEFWQMMTKKLGIVLDKKYTSTVEFENNSPERPLWLKDAAMNIARSCFGAEGKTTAIIYQGEHGPVKSMTYEGLDKLSNRIANSLIQAGIKKGDSCAIDMIMTAEAVAIYLGIVKAGCAVVSIADSLAPDEIEKRLRISQAKLIFTQDFILRGGKKIPLYSKVLEANPFKVVVLPLDNGPVSGLRKSDLDWSSFLGGDERFSPVSCNPGDVMNILFSSGTTGDPKAIPWTHTTAIKCASDGYLHHDIKPGTVVAWPTNLGWMMGPWLIFATLINKGTIALFYGAPTGRQFGEFVRDAKVNMLGLVPSIVKRWIDTDCMKGLDWNSIRAFSSTGESSNFSDYLWLMSRAGYKPVIEYCGGTEIGGGYATGTMVQPASPAAFSTPALGLDFILLDESGKQSDSGEMYLIPPSMGLSVNLLNKDHHEVYYSKAPALPAGATGAAGVPISGEYGEWNMKPILRCHGDELLALGGGYYRAQGRVDDTMNLGGIKVSSAEIERAVAEVKGVSESAAIAFDPPQGGPSELVLYVVPAKEAGTDTLTMKEEMQRAIAKHLNPLFRIKEVVLIPTLPRTASNKVMRRVLRKEYKEKS